MTYLEFIEELFSKNDDDVWDLKRGADSGNIEFCFWAQTKMVSRYLQDIYKNEHRGKMTQSNLNQAGLEAASISIEQAYENDSYIRNNATPSQVQPAWRDLAQAAITAYLECVETNDYKLPFLIKGITLGDEYAGKITEKEAVDLINTVIQLQIDLINGKCEPVEIVEPTTGDSEV